MAWVAAWALLAFLAFLLGMDHAARALGLVVPGFEEQIITRPPACPLCPQTSERHFETSSGFLEWFLNSFYLLAFFPALFVIIGASSRTIVARTAGYAVATVRLRGEDDKFVRVASLVGLLFIPLLAAVAYWVLPADPVPFPNER